MKEKNTTEIIVKKQKKSHRLLMFISGLLLGLLVYPSFGFIGNYLIESNSLNKNLPNDLDYSSVEEIYDALRVNYDGELTEEKILDGLKSGLAKSTGDPYTAYLSREENEEFDSQLSGTFTGIGAELIEENNLIVVATPLSGFPAEKAGLRSRDIIFKIDDEDATQLSVSEAVTKIRGEKGTSVKLTVARDGEQKEITIVRDVITVPSVKSEVIDEIGYMTIYRFGEDTYDLARKYSQEYVNSNLKGVIIDVRNNPGGYLDQAVKTASLWLDKNSVVVEERRGEASIKKDRAIGGNILKGFKTVVLINGGSASASEILAGALKDNNAATLIGDKTFGKGSVQQLEEFYNSTALKVTVAKWHTPSGKNIDKEGISPDKEVEFSVEDFENKIDSQKNAALEYFK